MLLVVQERIRDCAANYYGWQSEAMKEVHALSVDSYNALQEERGRSNMFQTQLLECQTQLEAVTVSKRRRKKKNTGEASGSQTEEQATADITANLE